MSIKEVMRSILVEGVSTIDVFFAVFLALFKVFQSQFVTTMSQFNEFFLPMCLFTTFESFYSIKFFHLSRFRNQISPPNVFLWKFQHSFLALKHYNL